MQKIEFYYNLNKEFQFSENELYGVISDFNESIDIFAYLVNIIHREKIKNESWKYFSETLSIKYLIQASSLRNLLFGTNLDFKSLSNTLTVFDITSFYVNTRSLIENYLTIFYLYFDKVNEEEKRVRWIIYEISGLKARQKLFTNRILREETSIKIAQEKIRIQELKNELDTYPFYSKLNENLKKRISKNNLAKILDWRALINRSKLSSKHFHRIWKLASNYAHSEYLSLMQVKDYWSNPNNTYAIRNLNLFATLLLNCVTLIEFKDLYPEIQSDFNKLEDNQKRIFKLLSNIGKNDA